MTDKNEQRPGCDDPQPLENNTTAPVVQDSGGQVNSGKGFAFGPDFLFDAIESQPRERGLSGEKTEQANAVPILCIESREEYRYLEFVACTCHLDDSDDHSCEPPKAAERSTTRWEVVREYFSSESALPVKKELLDSGALVKENQVSCGHCYQSNDEWEYCGETDLVQILRFQIWLERLERWETVKVSGRGWETVKGKE